ncbi:MAG: hypothetical protein ABSE16_07555 [Verrucomicrobiota bacterium]|jgi:hypothetical protein
MNPAPADSPLPAEPDRPSPRTWTRTRWLTLIVLVFALHVALLYAFGARKQITPRPVIHAPSLRMAEASDELLALDDPTLFALPHARDFAGGGLQLRAVSPPQFGWTEPLRWLPLPTNELGAVFDRFMQTYRSPSTEFPDGFAASLRPPAPTNAPELAVEPALPEESTLRITGELAQRLPTLPRLPSLPYHDVIAPSRVQVLVDSSGQVVSAVLLPSDNAVEAAGRADVGDTNALNIARGLRFTPASGLAFGELVFRWHTVPEPATNAPAVRP